MDLTTVLTCDLVEALATREGVEHHWIDAENFKELHVEGPSRILIVVD